jgi:hypothetical protein
MSIKSYQNLFKDFYQIQTRINLVDLTAVCCINFQIYRELAILDLKTLKAIFDPILGPKYQLQQAFFSSNLSSSESNYYIKLLLF